MFCENCGNLLKDTDKFCAKCGWKNPGGEVKQDNAPTSEATVATEAADKAVEPATGTAAAGESETASEAGTQAAAAEAAKSKPAETQGATVSAFDPAALAKQTGASAGTAKAAEAAKAVTDAAGKAAAAAEGIVKKMPLKLPIVIGAAAAVLVLLILVVNHAALGNFVRKTFYSPEKYYQYVEKKELKSSAAMAASMYDNLFRENSDVNDMSVDSEIELQFSEEGQDMISLAGLAGVDLSWLDTVKFVISTSNKQDVQSGSIEAYLSKDKLISANAILDALGEAAYIQIPELTDKYLGVETDEINQYYGRNSYNMITGARLSTNQAEEMITQMLAEFPDKKTVEKLLERYGNLALECINDVDINKDVLLRAEGVSQKCTKLTANIDNDTLEDILKVVLKEAKEDKDLKKLICNIVAVDENLDAEDVYEEFQEELEWELKNLSVSAGIKIELSVWLDGKGEVRGRSIEINDRYSKISIEARMPQKGKNFGYRLVANDNGQSVSFEGAGKRSGNKISGDFQVKYNGAGMLDIVVDDYNTEKAREGYINGSFKVQPTSQLMSLISMADITSMSSMLGKVSLGLDLESGKNNFGLGIQVIYDDESLGTLRAAVKTGKGKKVSIPNQKNVIMAEDAADVMDWLETINWDKYLSRLEKTELPSKLIDSIEEAVDMLEYYY